MLTYHSTFLWGVRGWEEIWLPPTLHWKYTGNILVVSYKYTSTPRKVLGHFKGGGLKCQLKVLIIIVLKESSLPLRISNELLGYEMLLLWKDQDKTWFLWHYKDFKLTNFDHHDVLSLFWSLQRLAFCAPLPTCKKKRGPALCISFSLTSDNYFNYCSVTKSASWTIQTCGDIFEICTRQVGLARLWILNIFKSITRLFCMSSSFF